MVLYMLSISAELDNMTNLQPRRGCDDPDYLYYLKLKCVYCREKTDRDACLVLSETVERSGGRNLVQKCKLCGAVGSIHMIPGHGRPLTLEQSQSEQFSPLMVLDCRDFEPISFSFGNGWKAESTSGTVFRVDLSEGGFGEYDEEGNFPVWISNPRGNFKRVRKNIRDGRTTYI